MSETFPHLSEAKLNGVFVGPGIRKIMFDKKFVARMTNDKKETWTLFKDVVFKFLGNPKDADKKIVQNMLQKFANFGCLLSLKFHFLNSHLDFFPKNLGAVSDEQGERFHQELKVTERRYQGRWKVAMIGHYCWSLHQENPVSSHKSSIQSFTEKRKRKY